VEDVPLAGVEEVHVGRMEDVPLAGVEEVHVGRWGAVGSRLRWPADRLVAGCGIRIMVGIGRGAGCWTNLGRVRERGGRRWDLGW